MSSRRRFLKTAFAASVMPSLSWADAGSPDFLAAAKRSDGSFALYGITVAGQAMFLADLPARGHAAAAHPVRPEAVAFARRPGTFAVVLNCVTGQVEQHIEAPQGRHFMGHGAFLAKGHILATTENDFGGKRGVLGLWEYKNGYTRIGEVPTHGIGPHDIKVLSGGRVVVANGGLLTHPDIGEGREILNVETMRSSLVYLKADLTLERRVMLEDEFQRASMRHLAVGPQEQVAFAIQWHGDPFENVPLLGVDHAKLGAQLFEPPLRETNAMKGYASSIAMNGFGDEVAITSSKGGRLQRFSLNGQFLGAQTHRDLSGIAPLGAGYLGSDGHGRLHDLSGKNHILHRMTDVAWDNHIVALKS